MRAFDVGAKSFLLSHNHPSGNVQPSQHDLKSNDQLEAIGNALDLVMIDHLIIARCRVYSMRQRRVIG